MRTFKTGFALYGDAIGAAIVHGHAIAPNGSGRARIAQLNEVTSASMV
jgi:hypothetical protein